MSTLVPYIDNNANILGKLIPFLRETFELRIFSMDNGDGFDLPDTLRGIPVLWGSRNHIGWFRKAFFSLISRVTDPHGYSDAIQVFTTNKELKRIRKTYPFEITIATIEPYFLGIAPLNLRNVTNVLYLMDPTNAIQGVNETKYRNRMVDSIIRKYDLIITTPFIRNCLASRKLDVSRVRIAGFPMIDLPPLERLSRKNDGKIDLLFCGWLYSDIRSPEYFIRIINYMDEHFRITFMGRDCELLLNRFEIDTKAEIIILPQQPYDVALQALADADILINIGNSVPVHMPSKTLEYINTGKPIINFYKMLDCPTLYYTKRYPLCLNIYEDDTDIDNAAEKVIDFCRNNIGKTVDRAVIMEEYEDCTSRYISEQIIDGVEELL